MNNVINDKRKRHKLNGDASVHAIRKHFLALDLPTGGDQFLLGWAFRAADCAVVYETRIFSGKSTESAGKPLWRFCNWLKAICAEAEPDAIFFKETPWFPAFPASLSFAAILAAFCEE